MHYIMLLGVRFLSFQILGGGTDLSARPLRVGTRTHSYYPILYLLADVSNKNLE